MLTAGKVAASGKEVEVVSAAGKAVLPCTTESATISICFV
jgi:hypothetical protein